MSSLWFLRIAKNQNIAPVSLELREFMIHEETFFLSIENIDNDSYEHVQHKKWASYHEEHEKEDLHWWMIGLLNLIDSSGIHSIPHDTDPTFCCHDTE